MKLRWGILGSGRICGDFCLALSTLDPEEHDIAAVAARDHVNAKAFAEKFNVKTAYGSYQELCQDKSIDVVYVGTLNTTHKDLSVLALSHGRHVLCEKPITMNAKELQIVLDFAKEKKLFFMEALWTRFFPLYRELHDNLTNHKIGRPLVAMVSFGYKALSENDRVTSRHLGGSPLLDVGVYALNFADFVFGGESPENVVAVGHLMDNGIDHSISITLIYKDKRTAQLLISAGCDLPNDAIVTGEKGRCTVRSRFWCPTEVEYKVGSKTEVNEFQLPNLPTPTYYANSAGMRYEAIHVRECIMKSQLESDIMNHGTSLRIITMMDDIRRQMGVVFDADSA